MQRSTFRAMLTTAPRGNRGYLSRHAGMIKRYRIAHQEGLFSDIEINRMEDWKDDDDLELEFE
jgi:hypothetical protein